MDILSHPRPTTSNGNEEKKCLVCADQAHCVHFGALSCKSCAAFFRRAVAVQSKFKCRRDGTCPVRRAGSKICSGCRYRRCLDVGMKESSVMCVLRVQAARGNTQASSLAAACIQPSLRYTIAANRCQKLRNFGSPTRFENRPACKGTIVKAFWSELRVLRDYFCSLDDDFYGLLKDDSTPALLAESFCMEWSLFETALTTLQSCGQKKRRLHFVDRSLVEITDSGLTRFYGSDLQIRDLSMVVSFCLERYLRFLAFVKCLEKAALDDLELTAFEQLLFAQCLPHLFKSLEERATFVDKTLTHLHKHYQSTYRDYVRRLDTLLNVIGNFLELKHAFEEMGVFVELHSRPEKTTGRPCTDLDGQAAMRFQFRPLPRPSCPS